MAAGTNGCAHRGWVLWGVTSTTATLSPPLCPWDMAGTGRVKETTLYTFSLLLLLLLIFFLLLFATVQQ